ncbi:MAG: hypothetical protein O2955_15465 [Planctomycetota bacterium]|nr:hypothetical protein [Planctomycetota bacterium]MDA1213913.1 hypothetical protein [Planctomycetota bacterium]
MSKHETPMTRWYWKQVGGTLIEEFYAVKKCQDGLNCEYRRLDAIILPNDEFRIAKQRDVTVEGKDVIVVQTKKIRLSMHLLGQAFFSAHLMKSFSPKSIRSIALCEKDDEVLRPLFEQYEGMKVVICPADAY